MSDVILCNRGDELEVIEEAKGEWLNKVLIALGVPEEVLDDDVDKNDVKDYLSSQDLKVWSDVNGSLEVFRRDKLVAQWKFPKLVIIKEDSQNWYYEIRLDEWALPFQMAGRSGGR